MNDLNEHLLIKLVRTMVLAEYTTPPVPVDALDDAVDRLRGPFPELDDEQVEVIKKILKSQIKVTMDPGATLTAPDHVKWLADKASQIEWDRWGAYKQLLMAKDFGMNVIARLDDTTADIVDCVGDPTMPGPWKRRGLVIGDVQSGKTASYLGVVNRAADVGYKLIILLAGGTEALRKQTQFRVDEGLIGRDSASSGKPIGVGPFHKAQYIAGQAMTTQMSDFRKKSKEASGFQIDTQPYAPPLVFVLKKNKTALENVRDWIKEQQLGDIPVDVPMLLLDDESDYASVNTKDEDEPTRINELIREILGTVSKSSYLAFTATPFANVFIDHETSDEALGDDLFPKDYIRTLEAPTNYVGSSRYFGTEDAPDESKLLTPEDAGDLVPLKHKSTHTVRSLPPSLLEAIRTFVVASAMREYRGDSKPRSMLINVSRYKRVQSQVHALVETEFVRIRNAVELHAGSIGGGQQQAELFLLEQAFTQHYGHLGVEWSNMVGPLRAAVHGVTVQLINSDRVKKADAVEDFESDRMIAVGGDVLSRGLTLEGLTISYFHRQAGAADTLLQMARWFGYRPGYDDLCRVWILPEVAAHFRYVDTVVRELREQVRAMKKQGLTPQDFGLRVRMHPESLLITARNKMKAAEAKPWTIDVAGARHLETSKVSGDPDDLLQNQSAAKLLVQGIESAFPESAWQDVPGSSGRAVRGVSRELVASFLREYVGFFADLIFADSALADFVANAPSKYSEWTVGVVSGSGATVELSELLEVSSPRRGVLARSAQAKSGAKDYFMISGQNARLAGSEDVARFGGVADKEKRQEPAVYSVLEKPVLLLYPLEISAKETREFENAPKKKDDRTEEVIASLQALDDDARPEFVLGVKVGIPGDPNDRSAQVKYMLNSVALNNWAGVELDDPDADPAEIDGGSDD